jgi:hypothetical protein
MADDPRSQANSPYVGYRHPPAGFSKGQSGNPAGRPKGAKNKPRAQSERLRSLMLKEAYRPIKVAKDGEEITVPLAQAVFMALAEAAAKGEARAQAMFLKIIGTTEDEMAVIRQMVEDEVPGDLPRRVEFQIVDPKDPEGPKRLYLGPGDE